jgi:hypothetical protein
VPLPKHRNGQNLHSQILRRLQEKAEQNKPKALLGEAALGYFYFAVIPEHGREPNRGPTNPAMCLS